MGRTRKEKFPGWMPGLYRKAIRAGFIYYALPDGKYHGLGNDIAKARRDLVDLQAGKPQPGTVAELLDDFHAYRQKKTGPDALATGTLERNAVEIAALKKPFGKMAITTFRRSFAWQYLHQFRGVQNPVSANREISYLSSAFDYAIDLGRIEVNPVAGVEYQKEQGRDRLVTHAELISFCEFAIANGHHADASGKKDGDSGRRIALIAQLAYLTSKAQLQVLRVTRRTHVDRAGVTRLSDIDAEGIRFGGRKRGHATMVLWTQPLRDVAQQLLALPAKADPVYLACKPDGDAYTTAGLKTMWQRIMRAWLLASPADAPRERFTFHDLRAKAITRLKEDGRQAMDLTGHTTERVADSTYDRRRIRKAKAVE